jgi:hypothetical protein
MGLWHLPLDAAAKQGRRLLAAAVLVIATLFYIVCPKLLRAGAMCSWGTAYEHPRHLVSSPAVQKQQLQLPGAIAALPTPLPPHLLSTSSSSPHMHTSPHPQPLHHSLFSTPSTIPLLCSCPQAHLGAKVDGKLTMPNMPDLLTGPMDDPDSVTLALPDNSSVPLPSLPGVDLTHGVAAVVPGERSHNVPHSPCVTSVLLRCNGCWQGTCQHSHTLHCDRMALLNGDMLHGE